MSLDYFFFFKQKTAYEMRISDWSSDVCSSDLSELAQIAGQASQLYTLSYSRSQEYEADGLGIRYLKRAGYDPFAAADMLDSLGRSRALDAQLAGPAAGKGLTNSSRGLPPPQDRVPSARSGVVGCTATTGTPMPFMESVSRNLVEDYHYHGVYTR